MKYQQAIVLAIRVLEKECQRLSFNANLAEYSPDTPTFRNAKHKRDRLLKAIETLKDNHKGE